MQQRRVNVRGIIFKDGKLFCQQLTPGSNHLARDYWCTPGGGMELNESLEAALKREIIEETGVTPQIGRLLFVQQYSEGTDPSRGKEELEFFFHITNPEDFEDIDLASTSHGEAEIARCNFISPSAHTVLPGFLSQIDIQGYIDETKPVYLYNELS